MSKNVRRGLVALLLVVVLLVVLGIIMVIIMAPPPPEPLPNPNGYDDFVRAGKMITGRLDGVSKLDHEELRALIETNAEPLRLARLGLTRRCSVRRDANIANFATALKRLATLLSAEGRLKELGNQPGEAATCYAETVKLGSATSHGGVFITRLVGIACEGLGASRLVKLVPILTCEQSRVLVPMLQAIDTNTVSWEEVLRNERRFMWAGMRKHYNSLELIEDPLELVEDLWDPGRRSKKVKVRHDFAAAHLRLLAAELALRCYREEQGRVPSSLDQLVPKYLSRVPLDPFSDHPPVYRAQGTNWLLYSVGPNRVDDGGKPFVRSVTGEGGSTPATVGDLRYDSRW